MDGHPGEWAVGFHGSTIEGTSSICDSRNFRVGPRNMFESDSDTNKLSDQYGQPCGKGIYFASNIEIAERYSRASVDDKQVVMQVRFSTFSVLGKEEALHEFACIECSYIPFENEPCILFVPNLLSWGRIYMFNSSKRICHMLVGGGGFTPPPPPTKLFTTEKLNFSL